MQLAARSAPSACRLHGCMMLSRPLPSLRAKAADPGHSKALLWQPSQHEQLSTAQQHAGRRCAASVSCRAGRRNGPGLGGLPTSLEAAQEEMALLAAPGSSSNPQALAAIQAAADKLGGMFFLVSCGKYDEQQPRAGQTAYSLFHAVILDLIEDPTGMSSTVVVGIPVVVTVLPFPPPQPAMVYFVAYELDANGWPTGAAYNTASAFERLTDRKQVKKVLSSCDIIFGGRQLTRLNRFYHHELQPNGVESVPPRRLQRGVRDWVRGELQAAGVRVIEKPDAVTNMFNRMKEKEEAAAAAAAAADQAGGAAPSAAPSTPAPGSMWPKPAAAPSAAPSTHAPGSLLRSVTPAPPAPPAQQPPVAPPQPPVNRVRRSRRTGA